MSEPVYVALIGVAGAILGALLTAFVQPLWERLIYKSSKLQVQIEHGSHRIPTFLKKAISEYIYNYKLKVQPSEETKAKLREFANKDGLSLIRIKNQSTRSIEGLVVHLDRNQDFIADVTIDGEKRDSYYGKLCEIGRLRAGAECKLILWTPTENTGRWSAKDAVTVSASEYDKITVTLPPPDYIQQSYVLLPSRFFWRAFWTILILINIAPWLPMLLALSKK